MGKRSEYTKEYYSKNKQLMLDKNKRWRKENPEKAKQISKLYYERNKERIRKRQNERYKLKPKPCYHKYYKQHIDEYRNRDFIRKYGITIDDYNKMFDKQHGLCAICSQPERYKRRGVIIKLAVDHSHNSGCVRQLLCAACNNHLGWYEKWKVQAESYLKGS